MYIKTLSTLAMVLCVLGCQPSTPTEKLVAKWGLDVECTIKQDPEVQGLVKLNRLSRMDMEGLHRFIAPTFDTFFFEFERDGRLIIKRNQISDAYNYTVTAPATDSGLTLSLSSIAFPEKQRASVEFDGDKLNLKVKATTYCLVEL